MKIEKLSENQIRCTLNKSDLASRQLKISELAYGSDKAKELFRDMMQQASYELGFEADDIPIMIEAIPVSADCIVLIVTKVDDPEELDTRFSKFSPSTSDYEDSDSDSVLDEFNSLQTVNNHSQRNGYPTAKEELDIDQDSSSKKNNSDSSTEQTEDILNLFSKVREYLNQSSKNAGKEQNKDDHAEDSDSQKNASLENSSLENASLENAPLDATYQETASVSDNTFDKPASQEKNSARNNANPADTDSTVIPATNQIEKENSFVPLKDTLKKKPTTDHHNKSDSQASAKRKVEDEKVVRIFTFESFDNFCEASKAVISIYNDRNSLYKNKKTSIYYLTLEKNICTAVNFNKTCNILSEYGTKEQLNTSSMNYFQEHFEPIIKTRAIQIATRI